MGPPSAYLLPLQERQLGYQDVPSGEVRGGRSMESIGDGNWGAGKDALGVVLQSCG